MSLKLPKTPGNEPIVLYLDVVAAEEIRGEFERLDLDAEKYPLLDGVFQTIVIILDSDPEDWEESDN